MSGKLSNAPFSNDEIEFLSILGNQIAVAIENARLYEGERRAIQELRSAQQLLLQTERLAALGEMSAKIAHEVNNPLGIIKNYVLLTKRELEGAGQSERYLGIVGDEIDRIARIVRQLLEFHRPGEATLEPIDLNRVIIDVLTLVDRQLASHGISVVTTLHPSNPLVIGSSENLKQVFLNLIINARDAMTSGGTLSVRTDVADNQVITHCCDTGPGIPAEIIPRIFEPFFTTKEPGEGTGLGLSVCYGIIKAHNGSIEFRNLDKGGCFEIRLPLGEPKGSD
jgi:C4-dicarboxylate-specific signal transduction histidine kinase